MTDISVTAANVRLDTTKQRGQGISGAAITAGQVIYKDPTLGTWFPLDCDAVGASAFTEVAIAGCSAPGAAQPIVFQNDPDSSVNMGATLVPGTTYIGSNTAGGVRPISAAVTGDIIVYLGIASTTALLKLAIKNTGIGSV